MSLSDDVQGDILFDGFPKQTETFWFFKISNAKKFCTNLAAVSKLITNCTQVQADRAKIDAARQTPTSDPLPLTHANIAFSFAGIKKLDDAKVLKTDLGISTLSGDNIFSKGMEADSTLGDPSDSARPPNRTTWDSLFKGRPFDGVVVVAGDSQNNVTKTLNNISTGLMANGAATQAGQPVVGDVRPGKMRGFEHFGFNDGISEPVVQGVNDTGALAQDVIDKSIFLVGSSDSTRPSWMVNGSFMAFRKLEQNVPAWNAAVAKEATARGISPALFGAKLMGRWASGCPIMQSTNSDIHAFGTENDFDFVSKAEDNKNDAVCPRGAHIRKTNPRDGAKENVHRIIRRGIPYGQELSISPSTPRGLLFVCYQSRLDKGYQFIQHFWVNNPGFPFNAPAGVSNGLDPVIGQNNNSTNVPITITTTGSAGTPNFGFSGVNAFVTPRGGEYFFVPPMSALNAGGALVTLNT